MSKQPLPTDTIELKVEDDGDIILIKRQEASDTIPRLLSGIEYKVRNLRDPDNDNMKTLSDELENYGCSIGDASDAIVRVLFENYNVEVKV